MIIDTEKPVSVMRGVSTPAATVSLSINKIGLIKLRSLIGAKCATMCAGYLIALTTLHFE